MIFMFSCKKSLDDTLPQLEKDNKALGQYFSAATSGYISAAEPLTYVLNVPLASVPEEKVIQEIIVIEPNVKGKTTMINNTVIKFMPDDSWENDKSYKITLNLQKLATHLTEVQHTIKTVPQEIKVITKGYYIADDNQSIVSLSVLTADQINPETLKSIFSSDAYEIEVVRVNDFEYTAKFKYKNKLRGTNTIRYDGTKIGATAKGKIDLSTFLPSKFMPVCSYHDAENEVFFIYFSEKLSPNQDLNGLISLNGITASYTLSNNRLGVWLHSAKKEGVNIIELQKTILSSSSQALPKNFIFDLQSKSDLPQIEFLSDGNYFPSDGEFKIPIKTHNLKELQLMVVEIESKNVHHFLAWQNLSNNDMYNIRMYGRPIYNEIVSVRSGLVDDNGWKIYGIDLSDRIKKKPGAIYYIAMDFAAEHTTLPCTEALRGLGDGTQLPKMSYFENKDEYLYRNYFNGYQWEERNNPCRREFYTDKEYVSRVFICSDYGLMAKKAGTEYHVSLWDLMDLSAINSAEVSFYNLQSELLGTTQTSNGGFAKFSSSISLPSTLEVKKDQNTTYMSLDVNLSNSISEFNTEGHRNSLETEFLLYTDRGFYRPGDSIYLSLMINKSQCQIPKGMPAVVKFYNPDNTLIGSQILTMNIENQLLYGIKFQTSSQSKTGTYRVQIDIGTKKMTKNIPVETIKPNIAESKIIFKNSLNNTVLGSTLSGSYTMKYLTGLPVKGGKIKAVARVNKIPQPFENFKDFSFDVLTPTNNSQNIDLFDFVTDDNGQSEFSNSIPLDSYNHPLRLSIEIDGLLPGGGTTKEGTSIIVQPLKSYVGLKNSGGSEWGNAYNIKDNVKIDFINLDNKGVPKTISASYNYTLYRNNSSWWMDSYYYGTQNHYNDESTWQEIENKKVQLRGKGHINFDANVLEAGEYKLKIQDPISNHISEVNFIILDSKNTHSQTKPYLTQIETDKTVYNSQDLIKIKLPSITRGKALVSIEAGNSIFEQKWFDISASEHTVVLRAEAHWPSHVYIHATIVQPYKQDNNDLPLRMYGIQSVEIQSKIKPLSPITNLASTLESNKTYTFEVREEEGRNMEYTLALIDEGLLNLSGFQTPQPKVHFSGKMPLLVKTWDIYKYLMNFFKGKFAGIISIGGDNAYKADEIPELNRFNPVVIHQGPFKINASGSKKHVIKIPNYIGKLRLMVVACSSDNFGHLEKMITVRNPLMVQTQFPRSLNVTDQVSVPVNVIKSEPSIKSATLSAETSNNLIEGWGQDRSISFSTNEQMQIIYNLKVKNTPGESLIKLNAKSGKFSMEETTNIAINYPNAFSSKVGKYAIEPGKNITLNTSTKGYPNVYSAQLTMSGAKVPNFTQYAHELITYPYGCLEQTTSAAFSQLYLDKIVSLSNEDNQKRIKNLEAAINKIVSLQMSSGSFSYWDNDYYDEWSDMYAGNFLIEAEVLNVLGNNKSALEKWLKRHTSLANNWTLNASTTQYLQDREIYFQSYRLYILAKSGKPAKSALNRFVAQTQDASGMVNWFIAGAYAYTGYETKAKEYVSRAQKSISDSDTYEFSFGTEARDNAIKVDVLAQMNAKKAMEDYYFDMVDRLNSSSWVSTQTKGYAFSAVNKYYGKSIVSNQTISYVVSGIDLKNSKYNHSAKTSEKIILPRSAKGSTIKIENTGKSTIYVHLTERYIDDGLFAKASFSELNMDVSYFNKTTGSSDITNVKAGDDLLINVSIKNLSPIRRTDMVLNLKMPSGFELLNPRLYATEKTIKNPNYNYQDFKDDRVYTFFDLVGQGTQTYTFKAKAAYKGDFYWPSISCENMYKGDIYAKTEAKRVKIE